MPEASMKILAVTGGRADWGLLVPVLGELNKDTYFDLELAVTGQHLTPGSTSFSAIVDDGFQATHRVDMLLADDTAVAVGKSMGMAIIGFADLLERERPDLMLVLGDRYEIHAAVYAALFHRIPVAHLCGGDVTEGAIDDAIRHGITKMSHLHFVTNPAAADRVAQLGEDPARIFTVGSPGLDRIRQLDLLSKEEFFASVGLKPQRRNLMVTYHPVTATGDATAECSAMLAAFATIKDTGFIISGSNSDPGGRQVDKLLVEFAKSHSAAVFVPSLGSQRYFSALSAVDMVVGNSSSGLYEAPSFRIPTVNIGDRQKGRLRASSIVDCRPTAKDIAEAIAMAFAMDCSTVKNPYGDGHSAEKIATTLRDVNAPQELLAKHFLDLAPGPQSDVANESAEESANDA